MIKITVTDVITRKMTRIIIGCSDLAVDLAMFLTRMGDVDMEEINMTQAREVAKTRKRKEDQRATAMVELFAATMNREVH